MEWNERKVSFALTNPYNRCVSLDPVFKLNIGSYHKDTWNSFEYIQHCNLVKTLNKSNYNTTNDIFIIQKFTTQINLYFNTNGSAMLGI